MLILQDVENSDPFLDKEDENDDDHWEVEEILNCTEVRTKQTNKQTRSLTKMNKKSYNRKQEK